MQACVCARVRTCGLTYAINGSKPQFHFPNSGTGWLTFTIMAVQALKHMVLSRLAALNI